MDKYDVRVAYISDPFDDYVDGRCVRVVYTCRILGIHRTYTIKVPYSFFGTLSRKRIEKKILEDIQYKESGEKEARRVRRLFK